MGGQRGIALQTHNLAPPKSPTTARQSSSEGNAFQKPYNHSAVIKTANIT